MLVHFGLYWLIVAAYLWMGLLCMFGFSDGSSLREVFSKALFWPYWYIKILVQLFYEAIRDLWRDYKKEKEATKYGKDSTRSNSKKNRRVTKNR